MVGVTSATCQLGNEDPHHQADAEQADAQQETPTKVNWYPCFKKRVKCLQFKYLLMNVRKLRVCLKSPRLITTEIMMLKHRSSFGDTY